ncbi:hypothetical protein [Winogradskyella sediminis]|uniref:hypothetical protein n=1 Tax=Winogradskyella sediminis TaxID=1382466 RepID=UPI003AA90CDB
MEKFDIIAISFIAFGVYCLISIKKDYAQYKKTKGLIDLSIYVRSIGVIVGSVVMLIYEFFRLFS